MLSTSQSYLKIGDSTRPPASDESSPQTSLKVSWIVTLVIS